MEPENRPYVDAETKPGDAGTEQWADAPHGSDDPTGRGSLAEPAGTTHEHGVIEGSPADAFINDPDAIGGRDDQDDRWRHGPSRQ